LVSFKTKRVATLVHIHGAQAEAKDIELACLARALTVALAVDQLFIVAALTDVFLAWMDTGTIVIDHAIGANRGANVALSHCE
jgi:hypothetical protein